MPERVGRAREGPVVIVRDAKSKRWIRFTGVHRVLSARSLPLVMPVVAEVEEAVRGGLCAAGFISYEAAPAFDAALAAEAPDEFPLVWFGLFTGVEEVALPRGRQGFPKPMDWKPTVSEEEHAHAVRAVRSFIESGDTYQVNLTLRLETRLRADPWQFFLRLSAAQDPPYGAYIETDDWAICSASPELFFTREGEKLVSRPMKGTASRGRTFTEDAVREQHLRSSEKERAENVMIVDMVRNDFGRIARTGSVRVDRLFETEKYPTVWQMTSTVTADTDASLSGILRATFPPASITGAPKVRTTQIIDELETTPRHIYTGTIGYMLSDGNSQFNVAIRTALVNLRTRAVEYGVGGGIVWDSDPASEWQECATKAKVLFAEMPQFRLLETILWTPRTGYFLKERHLKRLAESAAFFDFDLDIRKVRAGLARLSKRFAGTPHRVRVLVGRSGSIAFQVAPFPTTARRIQKVALARKPVDSANRFLYHKTTFRRPYKEARAKQPGFDDVVLWNETGQATESTIANVVVRIGNRLYTPPVSCGLLAGTMRGLLLERGVVEERAVSVDELLLSPAVFLANSVRGLYKVQVVDTRQKG